MNRNYEKVIDNIANICSNKNIINYCRKLLEINRDYIYELNDKCVRAKRYDEVLEVNISADYFTVYSTEWGTTSRRKITFFNIDNNSVVSFDDNEITNDGIIIINYTYRFINSECVSAIFHKKVNFEYELTSELKQIKKDEYVEIYPLDVHTALKNVQINGNIDYYLTNVVVNSLDDLNIFSFVETGFDEKIPFDIYQQKIKKLGRC